MMKPTQVAMYARVSSEQQAEAHTVASQVAAVRERVAADGLTVSEAMQFLDEGYSGATLIRPGLERLRDVIAAGTVDRLYVHSPDRLARKYAYQVILVEEFRQAGVEVVLLNRALGRSPEDDLLLPVQGMTPPARQAACRTSRRRECPEWRALWVSVYLEVRGRWTGAVGDRPGRSPARPPGV